MVDTLEGRPDNRGVLRVRGSNRVEEYPILRGYPPLFSIIFILLFSLTFTFSCEEETDGINDNDTTLSSPVIEWIEPRSGPPSGGTEVTIAGSGFLEGIEVRFGVVPSEEVTLIGETELLAITPAYSPDVVDVTVTNSDGGSYTLPDAFIYFGIDTEIDWVSLHWPSEIHGKVGIETENIYCWIYEEGVTDEEGQGEGVLVEVGFGPEGSSPNFDPEWLWFEETYNTDTGPDWDSKANDEYMGGVIPNEKGVFDLACRFTIDGGLTYAFGDLNGDSLTYDPAYAAKLYID